MLNAYYHKKIKAYLKILLLSVIYISIFISKSHAKNLNEVKVGILLGFSGAVESLTPLMSDSAEIAFKEVKDKELTFKLIKADTACNNINLANSAATKLVKVGVSAIIGGACPNITKEIAKEISIPKEVLICCIVI